MLRSFPPHCSLQEGTTRFSVLQSWITQMRYIVESDALVVACTDGVIYFLDVVHGEVLREYNAHVGTKIGVRAFGWSAFGKYIVSAADRTVLFWDLFTLESVYKIENLKSPVVTIDVQDEQNKLFAVLANKSVYMWHNITYELLQTISDPTLYKPLDTVTALAFSPDLKMLFTAGHKVTAWTLER
jgi:WD40 repeat protein